MKLQLENNEYYLMKDGEELAIATTDESFIKELGAERLSRKNCDEIKNGYDLDDLVNEIYPENKNTSLIQITRNFDSRSSFKAGFQKALEILGDKKFSEDELQLAFFHVQNEPTFAVFKESLQQTEWDVEIETIEYGFGNDKNGRPVFMTRNLLDENGCLIIKKK
jgi:hypothetical protein